MTDRLMAVAREFAWWLAELPVEVDCCAERDDAGEDAGAEAGGRFGEVALEAERVLQRLHDRLDALPDPADLRLGAVGFVGAAGSDDERLQVVDGLLELTPGEAFVAEDELSAKRLALEQGEPGIALGRVGGDEVEVDDRSIRAGEEHEPHAPEEARMRGRVAEAAVGSELRVVDGVCALAAGKRGRVEQQERVLEAGKLAGDRPPESDELGGKRAATLVVGRLGGQVREEVAQAPAGDRQEAP